MITDAPTAAVIWIILLILAGRYEPEPAGTVEGLNILGFWIEAAIYTALIAAALSYLIIIVLRAFLFKRKGMKFWKTLIPVYSEYISIKEYGECGMKAAVIWVLVSIFLIITAAFTSELGLPYIASSPINYLTGIVAIGSRICFVLAYTKNIKKQAECAIVLAVSPVIGEIMMLSFGETNNTDNS